MFSKIEDAMSGEGRKNDDGDIYQIVASQDCGK